MTETGHTAAARWAAPLGGTAAPRKPMKLLFFIFSLSGGGAERVTVSLANYWAARGWNITIVTEASAAHDAYVLEPSITRISLSLARESRNKGGVLLQYYRHVMELRRTLLDTRPDVAVAMMDTACVRLALAAWGLKDIAPIGSLHSHPPCCHTKPIWKRLQSAAYGQLPAILALTQGTAAWLAQNTNARRIEVIPNPQQWPLPDDMPKIAPDAVCLAGRNLLLAAGRLAPEKGFDLLIDAFAELSQRHPDWDLAIVGEGAERQRLELQISQKGLERRVLLPGWAGNMADWYKRAQLYVMSSRFEGFGNTLAEAMMYGVPVISFDCETGPRNIIRDGKDGFLVPKEDTLALASALERLMADEGLRMRFGHAAREARDRFALERVAQIWESVFEDLLAKRSRAGSRLK